MDIYEQLKILYTVDEEVRRLYNFLRTSTYDDDGYLTLVITPSKSASPKIFKKLLHTLDVSRLGIARSIRDGEGYEFILRTGERIVIQDVSYIQGHQRDGLRFKDIIFME